MLIEDLTIQQHSSGDHQGQFEQNLANVIGRRHVERLVEDRPFGWGATPLRTGEACYHASSNVARDDLSSRESVKTVTAPASVTFEADAILEDELEDKAEMWYPILNSENGSSMWPIESKFKDDMWRSLKFGSQLTNQENRFYFVF